MSPLNLKALPNLKKLNITHCKNITAVRFDHLSVLPSLAVVRCEAVLSSAAVDVVRRKINFLVQDDYMRKRLDYKNDPWYH